MEQNACLNKLLQILSRTPVAKDPARAIVVAALIKQYKGALPS